MTWDTYRALPLLISAAQWNGPDDTNNIWGVTGEEFFHPVNFASAQVFYRPHNKWLTVKRGDFVVRGIQGEFYPVDPKVLRTKYELLESGSADEGASTVGQQMGLF